MGHRLTVLTVYIAGTSRARTKGRAIRAPVPVVGGEGCHLHVAGRRTQYTDYIQGIVNIFTMSNKHIILVNEGELLKEGFDIEATRMEELQHELNLIGHQIEKQARDLHP